VVVRVAFPDIGNQLFTQRLLQRDGALSGKWMSVRHNDADRKLDQFFKGEAASVFQRRVARPRQRRSFQLTILRSIPRWTDRVIPLSPRAQFSGRQRRGAEFQRSEKLRGPHEVFGCWPEKRPNLANRLSGVAQHGPSRGSRTSLKLRSRRTASSSQIADLSA
jgi:hypothetical protein